ISFAAAIGPVISGIASLAGAIVSASAMSAQAAQEEELARWNADRQREEAAWAQAKGAADAAIREKEYKRAASKAKAVLAQSGASTTEGTPLLVQQEFAAEKMFASNIEMANATKQQRDMLNRAAATEWEGRIRADAARANATASLISGVAGAFRGIAGAFG